MSSRESKECRQLEDPKLVAKDGSVFLQFSAGRLSKLGTNLNDDIVHLQEQEQEQEEEQEVENEAGSRMKP